VQAESDTQAETEIEDFEVKKGAREKRGERTWRGKRGGQEGQSRGTLGLKKAARLSACMRRRASSTGRSTARTSSTAWTRALPTGDDAAPLPLQSGGQGGREGRGRGSEEEKATVASLHASTTSGAARERFTQPGDTTPAETDCLLDVGSTQTPRDRGVGLLAGIRSHCRRLSS